MLDGPTGLFSFGMTLSLGSITVSSGEVLGVGTEEFGKTQLSTQKCIRARLWAQETIFKSQYSYLRPIPNTKETRETASCDIFLFSYFLTYPVSKLSTAHGKV